MIQKIIKSQKQFVTELANELNTTQANIKVFTDAFINKIKREIANGNTIKFNKFGKFSLKETPSRKAFNPAKQTHFMDKAKKRLKFTRSKTTDRIFEQN